MVTVGVGVRQVLVVGEQSGMLSCQGQLRVEQQAVVHAGSMRPGEEAQRGAEGRVSPRAGIHTGRVEVRQ